MQLLINIDVDNLASATRFYTTAFQLKVGRRFGHDGVELLGAAVPIYLLHKQEGSQPASATNQVRNYGRHWTPVHLDVVVDDIERAVDVAVSAGAVLEHEIRTNSWGKLAILADPFGHGICLVQFVGKGYDEIATAA